MIRVEVSTAGEGNTGSYAGKRGWAQRIEVENILDLLMVTVVSHFLANNISGFPDSPKAGSWIIILDDLTLLVGSSDIETTFSETFGDALQAYALLP